VIRKLLITSVQIILNKTSQNKSQSTLLPNTSVQRYHYTNLFLYIPYQKNNNTTNKNMHSTAQATAVNYVL